MFLNGMNIGKGTGFAESITGCRRKSGLQNTRHVDLQETPQVKKKKNADGMGRELILSHNTYRTTVSLLEHEGLQLKLHLVFLGLRHEA